LLQARVGKLSGHYAALAGVAEHSNSEFRCPFLFFGGMKRETKAQ
jgi:hypothetical protein